MTVGDWSFLLISSCYRCRGCRVGFPLIEFFNRLFSPTVPIFNLCLFVSIPSSPPADPAENVRIRKKVDLISYCPMTAGFNCFGTANWTPYFSYPFPRKDSIPLLASSISLDAWTKCLTRWNAKLAEIRAPYWTDRWIGLSPKRISPFASGGRSWHPLDSLLRKALTRRAGGGNVLRAERSKARDILDRPEGVEGRGIHTQQAIASSPPPR